MYSATTISQAIGSTMSFIGDSSVESLRPSASPHPHSIYYHGASPPNSTKGHDNEDNGECKLLGSFSIFIQVALGALALLSLVFKRWRERPQRPVKVWAFDVSKQVFGSAMLHLANLLISMISAGQLEAIGKGDKPNPCSFYLLNLGIDTTLGIPILIVALRILKYLASYTPLANPPESIESGNYGHPPKALWWFKQAIIYFLALLIMKACVFILIQLFPFIVNVGDWALKWTEGNTALQIIFVMLLFPVAMNAIQYYIIDIFIKKPISQDIYNEPHDSATDDDSHRQALLNGLDGAYSDSDVDDVLPAKTPSPLSEPLDVSKPQPKPDGSLAEDQSTLPPYEPRSSGSSSRDQK
ncbi:hypothetical protein N7495_006157 [Penicillium taxi]|uniref:uncharacterized protein n=1 Tax=Penicillium taxi TaxID=168475 RepID=UPI002544D94D|nr:uncharacterized protein N7495_006157 [Penicillium taxi]KAJ5894466.1 hypothetical protein N7495_006157 [Penicillium taxi]